MSFKYIDPGYGVLCRSNLSSSSLTGVFKSNIFNPRNGVAFYTTGRRMLLCPVRMSEFYAKFDIFLPETANGKASIYSGYNFKLLQITQSGADFVLSVFIEGNVFNEDDYFYDETVTFTLKSADGDATNLKAGAVNTIWLHAIAGSSESTITVIVNNECVVDEVSISDSRLGNVAGFNISAEMPISNVIISDEEIALKETVVAVGHSAVETTMTENDGAYSSAMAGAYVLQTLDTTDLYGLFGSDSKVTGLVAIAAPAFRTGEDVTKIKCRRVDGETVTDYWIPEPEFDPEDATMVLEAYSEEEVAALEDKMPAQGKQLDVTSDTTFASLNGLKVGWVTA